MEQKQVYHLLSITTTEANFKRENNIDENYLKVKNNLDLNISKSFDKENFGVFLTVDLKQEFAGKNLVEIKVTCVGVFKKNAEVSEKALDDFCNINAPAIIFPFVREIISNLSTKGGLQPIIIQPINFVDLAKNPDKTQP